MLWLPLVLLLLIVTPLEAAPPIKIGAIFDLSGPGSQQGQIYQGLALAAVEAVNQRGGIRGRPLELIILDDQGLPEHSTSQAQRLIRQGVVALIGPSEPRSVMGLRKIADWKKIPLIITAGQEPLFRRRGEPFSYNFKVGPALPPAIKALYGYLRDQGLTQIGLLLPSNRQGRRAFVWLKAYAAEFRLRIVAREWFGPRDTDVEAQLRNLKSKGIQAIVAWAGPRPSATVVNSWTGNSFPPLFLGYQTASVDFRPRILPPGVKAVWPKFILTQGQSRFQLALKRLGRPAEYFSASPWDAVMLLAMALKRSGNDRQTLRWVLENLGTVDLISGTYHYLKTDHYHLDPKSFIITGLIEGNLVE
ncbi:ABC transporter substrate-binding protein [Thermosulfuriphilus sp.]